MGEREVLTSKPPAEKLRKFVTRGLLTTSLLIGAAEAARIGYTTILEQTRLRRIDATNLQLENSSDIIFGHAPHNNRWEELREAESSLGLDFSIANFF